MTVTRFKALSDETRLRLLRILMDDELSVNELVSILGMGQSRISRHLRILADAGLLSSRRDGLWVFYRGRRDGSSGEFLEAVAPFLGRIPEAGRDAERTRRLLEERTDRSRRFFSDIADRWDALIAEVLGDFDLPGEALRAVPEGCRLAADLGCGTGTVLRRLLGAADRLVGVDMAQGMLDACAKAFADAEDRAPSLRIGEIEHLPMKDGEADFASLNLVLHHVVDPGQALREIGRVLAPGGRLFLCDFLKHEDETMRTRWGDRWLGFDPADLARWLGEAGFRCVETRRRAVNAGHCLLLVDARAPAGA